jgi:hypothetical protein
MNRSGRARESSRPSARGDRSRPGQASRGCARRHRAEQVDERTEAQRLVDMGWVEWGDELIWEVQAMGLCVTGVDDRGLASAEWLDGCGAGFWECDVE